MIVEVEPATIGQQSGVPAELSVRIENVRDVIAGISVHVLGADPNWAQISESELSLFPGESRTIDLLVLLPETMPAGTHTLTVQVLEHSGVRECVLRPVTVQVAPRELLFLTMKPPMVPGGKRARFGMRAENSGNTVITRPLLGQDDEGRLGFEFAPERLDLAPGEQARIAVTVSARRPWTGISAPRMFTVHADTRTPAERQAGVPVTGSAAQGAFLQQPRISRAVLSLGTTLVALLVVLVIATVTIGAILQQHNTELANSNERLAAVSDPSSHAAPTGAAACPCVLTGHVISIGTGHAYPTGPTSGSPGPAHGPTPVPSLTPSLPPNLFVGLYSVSNATRVARVPIDAEGHWRAEVSTSGDYLIRFSGLGVVPTWYPQAVDALHATPVTVSHGTTDLPVMMSGLALGSISVTLNIDNAVGAQVDVRLADGTGLPGALVSTAKAAEGTTVFRAERIPSPGSFVVVAEKEGYRSASLPVELGLGEERSVDVLSLTPVPVPTTPVPTTPVPTTAPSALSTSPASTSPATTTSRASATSPARSTGPARIPTTTRPTSAAPTTALTGSTTGEST